MQFRTLQITQLSGKNLPSEKMPIYAAVSISGETEQYTKPSGSANPTWNSQMEFKVGEMHMALQENSPTLEFRLLCNAAGDKEVVVGRLEVSVKQLFESRKSPHVGSVSGEHGDDAGELTFSYKFIAESAPNASGSGPPGWKAAAADRAGVVIKVAADVAGAGMKVAADVGGVGKKVAADVAGVGMKAAADVGGVGMKVAADVAGVGMKAADVGGAGIKAAANAIMKFVKNEKVESGKKDEKEKEKEMREKMNAIRNLPAQRAPASSKAGTSSTNNAKTQGGQSTQNTGLRTGEATGTGTHNPFQTGEATGTCNRFQTVATKFMPTGLSSTFFRTGGRKDYTNPND